jgi:putative NADPH-quinone reductase
MSILVVLAHPHPGSFNHAIAAACLDALHSTGHRTVSHDLYQESFNPVLPHTETVCDAPLAPAVEAHCCELASADGIVVVHLASDRAQPSVEMAPFHAVRLQRDKSEAPLRLKVSH